MRDLELKRKGNALEAVIQCELDHHKAIGIREEIDRALLSDKPKTLTLDFSAVPFMDSSGIGLIIGRADKATQIGCQVRVSGLKQNLLRLVRLSGISKLENVKID